MTERELLAKRQSIIRQLTRARLEKGLSQAQLAGLIGTRQASICRLESGEQNLSLDMMLRTAPAETANDSRSQGRMCEVVFSPSYVPVDFIPRGGYNKFRAAGTGLLRRIGRLLTILYEGGVHMAVLDGCESKYKTPALEERVCPECGEEVEVFTVDGKITADSECSCGYVFRAESWTDNLPVTKKVKKEDKEEE